MKETRQIPGIKKVLVASGIRMDLARRSPEYLRELVLHHVGGRLKVAPEHTDPQVLDKMRKPSNDDFEKFTEAFQSESAKAGKKQYIVPYFIASHPGSDLNAMIDLAVFLKRNGYRPDQVQDFIPAPFDIATAMYYTGIDPFSKQPVHVARKLRDRKLQRALMQFFKPENYFEVREALRQAGRQDLIGNGCDCLIPSTPPREAIEGRRKDANARFRGDYVHTISDDKKKKASAKNPATSPAQGIARTGNPRHLPQRRGRKDDAAGNRQRLVRIPDAARPQPNSYYYSAISCFPAHILNTEETETTEKEPLLRSLCFLLFNDFDSFGCGRRPRWLTATHRGARGWCKPRSARSPLGRG